MQHVGDDAEPGRDALEVVDDLEGLVIPPEISQKTRVIIGADGRVAKVLRLAQQRHALRVGAHEEQGFVEAYQRPRVAEAAARELPEDGPQTLPTARSRGPLQLVEFVEQCVE